MVTTSNPAVISEPIIKDHRLRKLSFTGSIGVGRILVEQSAHNLLRTSMELGGNAPFIVFNDADLDAAVEGALTAKMSNIGEACTAANRFYIADSVYDAFVERFAKRMSKMKIGHGIEEGVEVGPLINEQQRERVDELVQDAVSRGATTVVGGQKINGNGYFYPPTVLSGVPEGARLLSEEIFGPVAPIKRFQNTKQVLRWANNTNYGLVAYVYTRDLNRALNVMEKLEYGMVGLNRGRVSNEAAPFGGIKQSGFGREGGYEGIEEYLETKYCAITL